MGCMASSDTKMHQYAVDISEKVWAKYDKDGNGYLDKEECVAYVKETVRVMTEKGQKLAGEEPDEAKLKEMIMSYDINNDGNI